jgi:two-component system chemotaxis response regulator CheB
MREILVLGAGRGGLKSLETVLVALPEDFAVPVIVAYHRAPGAEPEVRAMLHAKAPLPVREVEDKDELASGTIHLAPPDYHLLVEEKTLALSTEAPVQEARPSIDALFESASDSWKARVTAVLLASAGVDGSRGVLAVKRRGGHVILEEPVNGQGTAEGDDVLTVGAIGPALVARLHRVTEGSALRGGVS